jgi:hypothetical protein
MELYLHSPIRLMAVLAYIITHRHIFTFLHFTNIRICPKWTTEGTILRFGSIASAHSSFKKLES